MTSVGDVVGDTYGILQIKPGVASLGIMVSYCLRFASQILFGQLIKCRHQVTIVAGISNAIKTRQLKCRHWNA